MKDFDYILAFIALLFGAVTLLAVEGLGVDYGWVWVIGSMPLAGALLSLIDGWPWLRQFGELLGRATIVFLILLVELESGVNPAGLAPWLSVALWAAATAAAVHVRARRAEHREARAQQEHLMESLRHYVSDRASVSGSPVEIEEPTMGRGGAHAVGLVSAGLLLGLFVGARSSRRVVE